jgi:hypothetical protein
LSNEIKQMMDTLNYSEKFRVLLSNCHESFLERYRLPLYWKGGYKVSLNKTIDEAWKEFYSDTMYSSINITYNLEEHFHSLGMCPLTKVRKLSPLAFVRKVKEIIKCQSSINDINYIHLFKNPQKITKTTWGIQRQTGGDELDDNKSLHSYGYSGRANLYVYLWDPKNPPQEPSPEPAPEPVRRDVGSVIQAIPLSESENEEIKHLKKRVSELERLLKENTNWL